ncbi:unnamed protein product, partial [Oncorhynchus mykiss]
MQEQMQRLQQQLEASQKSSTATSTPNSIPGTKAPSKANTPSQGPPKQSSSKPVRPTQKTKPQAEGKPSSAPDRGDSTKLQESSDFTAQLNNADLFKRKAHQVQPSTTAAATDTRGPLVEIKTHSSFQPIASSSRTNSTVRSSLPSQSNAAAALSAVRQANPLPSLPKDVAIEKYSGLRLRSEHTHTHSSTCNTHTHTHLP